MDAAAHLRAPASSLLVTLVLLTLPGWLLLPLTGHPMLVGGLCAAGLPSPRTAWLGVKAALSTLQISAWLANWGAMLLVTAPPLLTWPLARLVREGGGDSRSLAAAALALGYGVVWLAAGIAALAPILALQAYSALTGTPAVVLALGVALVWQATPWKQRALRDCRGLESPRRAQRMMGATAFRDGVMLGVACVGACWAAMLVPMLMAAHGRAGLALATALIVAERMADVRQRRGRVFFRPPPGAFASLRPHLGNKDLVP